MSCIRKEIAYYIPVLLLVFSQSLFADLSTGLISHYPLDGNFNDIVGGKNGVNHGASPEVDRFGSANSAMYFDGSDYATFTDVSHMQDVDALSVSLWVKIDQLSNLSQRLVCFWGTSNGDAESFCLTYSGKYNAFHISLDTLNNTYPDHFSYLLPESVKADEWHHFAFTYDGSVVKGYLNGVEHLAGSASGKVTNNPDPYYFGQGGSSVFPNYEFNGVLDDVRFYGRALTAAEVQELNSPTPPPAGFTDICSDPIGDISNANYTNGIYRCVTTDSITPSTNVNVGTDASLFLGSPKVQLGNGFHVSNGGSLSVITTVDFEGLVSGIEQIILPAADENNQINVFSGLTAQTGHTTVIFKDGITDTTHTFSLENSPIWLIIDPNTGALTINAPQVSVTKIESFTLKVTTVEGSRSITGTIAVSPIDLAETYITSGEAETVTLAGVKLDIPAGEFPAGMDIRVLQGTTESGDRALIIRSDSGQLAGRTFTLTFPQTATAQTVDGGSNGLISANDEVSRDDCKPNAPYPVALSNPESKRYFLYGDFRMGEGQQESIEVGTEFWDAIDELLLVTPVASLYYVDDITFIEKWAYVLCSRVPVNEIPIQAVDREPVLLFHGYNPAVFGFGGGEGTWNKLFDILYAEGWILPFEFRWLTNASYVDAAQDLRETAKEIKFLTQKDVHFVAHSFGGLLARTYLQGLDYGREPGHIPPVASLTTVGTPHSGIFSKTTSDGFPDGRDESITGYGIAGCMQTSCWEAGDNDTGIQLIFALISTVEEGGIPRALNSTGNRFPDDLPIQSLMGLRRLVGESIRPDWDWLGEPDPTQFAGGDGLLSFEGQRFRPDYGTSVDLLGSQADWGPLDLVTISGARVREAVLEVDRADPSFEGDSVSIDQFPGFGHTKHHRLCHNWKGGPIDWWFVEPGYPFGVRLYCDHPDDQALEGEAYVRNDEHPLVKQLFYWLQQFPSQSDLPSVNVTATAPNASESGAVGKIAFQLDTPLLWDITISYGLSGTATTTSDYSLIGGTSTNITIPTGSTQAILEIHPVDDSVPEPGGETVIVTLQSGDYYDLGGSTSATVNIADNDSAPPNTAQMLLLLDRTGSMDTIRPLTGNSRCSDSLQWAETEINGFYSSDGGSLALWVFSGSSATNLTGGFVDKATALNILNTLSPSGCSGETPLAEAICDASDELTTTFSSLAAEKRILTIATDGDENNSDGSCAGPESVSNTPPYDASSWQGRVWDKVVGQNTVNASFWENLSLKAIDIENSKSSLIPKAVSDVNFLQQLSIATGGTFEVIGDVPAEQYTKLDISGNTLSSDAAEWFCVKDNHSGLVWEVKTNDGGLRDRDWYYTWGSGGGGNCQGSRCDTTGYMQAVNAQGICGRNNWRLASKDELKNLVYCSNGPDTPLDDFQSCNQGSGIPSIDTNYFPQTISSNVAYYWTGTSNIDDADQAWYVYFYDGTAKGDGYKRNYGYLRLVHD